MMLLSSGATVDDRDAVQQTPLHHACDWNNTEVNRYSRTYQNEIDVTQTIIFENNFDILYVYARKRRQIVN